MSMIKVSVIVPVYNVEDYIEECLDSLVEQTLSELEIILIDDGSTDRSGDICDRYVQQYENVRVVHKSNEGLGNARNVGFTESKGKYVYFIDSDDLLDKDALRVLYEEAEKDSLDIILFSAECFSDDPEVEFNAAQYKRTAFLNDVKSGRDMFFCLYGVGEYYPSIPLRFYKRTFLECKGYSFPEGIIHEDEAYGCLSLIEAGKVKCLATPFYKRRYRKGSIMTSKRAYNSVMGMIYTWKTLVAAVSDLGLNEGDKKKYYEFVSGFIYQSMKLFYSSFNREDKNKFKKVRKEILENVHYKELSIGLRLFLFSPFVHLQCARLLDIYSWLRNLKQNTRQTYLFLESVLKLFTAHRFGKDKTAAILIGTPTHGNLGDQAIVYAEHKFLEQFKDRKNIVEFSSQCYLKNKEFIKKIIAPQDWIIIDGGGSMGTLWIKNEYRFRDIIERFPKNRIFIFPQTAYFAEDAVGMAELKKSVDIYSDHKNLVIFCRDKATYSFVQKEFSNNSSYYMPDMVLSIQETVEEPEERDGVLICLRGDKERITDRTLAENIEHLMKKRNIAVKRTSTIIYDYVDSFNRLKELQKKWDEFAHAKLVITDRLHAMIFCAITQTPCIALDNVSHKVKGGYEWIKTLPYIMFNETGTISEDMINTQLSIDYERKKLNLASKYNELRGIVEGGTVNAE